MTVYLNKAITSDEYKTTRNKLVLERQELTQNLQALETNRGSWFKPAIAFIKAAESAVFVANGGTEATKLIFCGKSVRT